MTANDAVQELLERVRLLCREQESNTAELEANFLESFDLAKANWTGTSLPFSSATLVYVCVLPTPSVGVFIFVS